MYFEALRGYGDTTPGCVAVELFTLRILYTIAVATVASIPRITIRGRTNAAKPPPMPLWLCPEFEEVALEEVELDHVLEVLGAVAIAIMLEIEVLFAIKVLFEIEVDVLEVEVLFEIDVEDVLVVVEF
jgi:hypothetical protein